MTGRVVATHALPEPSLSSLEPDFDVRVLDYRPAEGELAAEVADADALITLVTDPVTEAVLRSGKKLKIVGQYGVGLDNIDRQAAGGGSWRMAPLLLPCLNSRGSPESSRWPRGVLQCRLYSTGPGPGRLHYHSRSVSDRPRGV